MHFSEYRVDLLPVEMFLPDNSLDSLGKHSKFKRDVLDGGTLLVVAVDQFFGPGGETAIVSQVVIGNVVHHNFLPLVILVEFVEVDGVPRCV